jgi:hypothetical protein
MVARRDGDPTVQTEQVALVYDAQTHHEHFIRQVAFQQQGEFGFLVPVPGKPSVHAAAGDLFTALRRAFPFSPLYFEPTNGLTPRGAVVEQTRVGSLDVTVLKADGDAVLGWLGKHQFARSAAADAWVQHYVKLGFYIAAFRYDGQPRASYQPETVDVEFDAPAAYYPYFEPDDVRPHRRRLSVWAVTRGAVSAAGFSQPINGSPSPELPWLEGVSTTRDGRALTALGVPAADGAWTVTPFRDDRATRASLGDVWLLPRHAGEAPEDLTPLLGALLPRAGVGVDVESARAWLQGWDAAFPQGLLPMAQGWVVPAGYTALRAHHRLDSVLHQLGVALSPCLMTPGPGHFPVTLAPPPGSKKQLMIRDVPASTYPPVAKCLRALRLDFDWTAPALKGELQLPGELWTRPARGLLPYAPE